jgi:hypothetical protein
MSLRRRVERDASGEEADGILRAPKQSAKHKMSQSPTAYGSMGQVKKQKEEVKKRGFATVDFVLKRTKRIFHLSTSRRAVYCRVALESRSVARCDRLR